MKPELFENHILFEKLDQLSQIIKSTEFKEKTDLENISFYDSTYNYISDRINLTIPLLVQQNEMDALSNEVDAGLQQLNLFITNSNVGHLNNSTNNYNSAISRIRNFPLPFSKNDFNFSKAIANFQTIVEEKYKSLEAKNSTLNQDIDKLNNSIVEKEAEIDRLFKLVETKDSEIQNLNSNFQTGFENLKSKTSQDVENDRNSFRSEFDNEKKTFKDEFNQLKNDLNSDTTTIVVNLEKKLEDATKIVNVIGNVGVTGNYQLIANEHKSSANFWRWVAIVFMASFSGLLIWTIIDLSAEGFNWIKSLIRLVAAAALSYPATYAARESTKHRKLETINRTAELELSSINPFIEILSDQKKQEIKEKLVEKYFGNNTIGNDLNPNDEGLSISAFEKIVSSISKLKS